MSDEALISDQQRLTADRRSQAERVEGWREVLNPAPSTSKAPTDLTDPRGGPKQSVAPPQPKKR